MIQHYRWFGDTDKYITMTLRIRTIIQGDKTVDEHIQDFEKAALEVGYEGYLLIIEFKWSLYPVLKKYLSKIWPQPVTIGEWYNKTITINRQCCCHRFILTWLKKPYSTVIKPYL